MRWKKITLDSTAEMKTASNRAARMISPETISSRPQNRVISLCYFFKTCSDGNLIISPHRLKIFRPRDRNRSVQSRNQRGVGNNRGVRLIRESAGRVS